MWAGGLASAQRIADVLAVPVAVTDAAEGTPLVGGFELADVEHGPLRGLSVEVGHGEWVGLACAEGDAAAAVLALAARHHDPVRGTVVAGGVAAPTVGLEAWRTVVGTSDGRSPWLAAGTLASNLALGASDRRPGHLLDSLLAAGGDDLVNLGAGLDLEVGERGVSLSGGQRQRLTLAGALAAEPDVLVALDPTTALDAVTEQRVLARLRRRGPGARPSSSPRTPPPWPPATGCCSSSTVGWSAPATTRRSCGRSAPTGSSCSAPRTWRDRHRPAHGHPDAGPPAPRPPARLGATAVAKVLGLTAVANLAGVAGPALIGAVVNAVASPTPGAGARIDRAAVLYTLLVIAAAWLTWLTGSAAAAVGESALAELRTEVFDAALDLPPGVVERAGTGDLVSRLGGDVALLSQATTWTLPAVVFQSVNLVLTVIAIVLVDVQLAVAALLAAVGPVVLASAWYQHRAPARYRAERERAADLAVGLHEAYHGAPTLWARRAVRPTLLSLARRGRAQVDSELLSTKARNVLRPGVSLGQAIGLAATIVVATHLVAEGTITVGAASAVALYLIRLFDPVGVLLEELDNVQSAFAALARLVGVVEAGPPPATDRRGAGRLATRRRHHRARRVVRLRGGRAGAPGGRPHRGGGGAGGAGRPERRGEVDAGPR